MISCKFNHFLLCSISFQHSVAIQTVFYILIYLFWFLNNTELIYIWISFICNKVLKYGLSKICGRQPLRNITWPILEYFVSFKDVSEPAFSSSKLTIETLWTYFKPCSSVSIVNFEHVIVGWDITFFFFLETTGKKIS